MESIVKALDTEVINYLDNLSKDPTSSLDNDSLEERIKALDMIESYLTTTRELFSQQRRNTLTVLLARKYNLKGNN